MKKMILIAVFAIVGCSGGQESAQDTGWIGAGGVWKCEMWTHSRAGSATGSENVLQRAVAASWVQGFVSSRLEGRGFTGLKLDTVHHMMDVYCEKNPGALLGTGASTVARDLISVK